MNKAPKGYISIKEATKLSEVSSKTIRRKIKDKKVKSRKVKGKYFVNLQSLKELYPDIEQKNEGKNDEKKQEDNYVTVPKDVLKSLQDQLKEKDRQIGDYKELLKNQQILHKDLQERMPMLEPPKEYTQDKEGFWSRVARKLNGS